MNFQSKVKGFSILLASISPESVSNQTYCQNYLKFLIEHRAYYLELYAAVLTKAMAMSHAPIQSLTLLDTGAGNGLLGIFASYCGFAHVVINDRDPIFVDASQQLSQQLGLKMAGFISGDLVQCKAEIAVFQPDVLVATDLIEHIYDPTAFLKVVAEINPEMLQVFTTGSNPANPLKVNQLRRLQLKDELEGGNPSDSILFGQDAHPPYLDWRKQLIKQHDATIPDSTIENLAKATRGLQKVDIYKAVDQFKRDGLLPISLAGGCNTCHPITGSWTERLVPLATYQMLFAQQGFQLTISPGFYNVHKKGLKALGRKFLNALLVIFGIKIAPFIFLSACRKH